MKEEDLSQEQRTARMKEALYVALKAQLRLNKAADTAAIADGFVPPSALPWTERFK